MVRSLARRSYPVIAWAYVAALAVQIFFAGMYVFAGASNIGLHRNMAHVVGLASLLLVATAFVGGVDRSDKRVVLASIGLLILQGMLVHVHQWFDMPLIASLHPVNAMVLTWVAVALARRASANWTPIRQLRTARVPESEPAAA